VTARTLTSAWTLLALAVAVAGCAQVEAEAPVRTAPAAAVTDVPEAPARPRGRATVHVTKATLLRESPGGRVVARIEPRTEFDSPTVLPVVRHRHGWYGVLSTHLPNGRIGWISERAELTSYATAYRIVASLGRREVVVRRGRRVVQRFRVAIGSPSTPTPTGRFAVTDKLLTRDATSPYGCCILALSAHQPHTPQGWGGGDRVAIHATSLPETIGTAASLGCLRGPEDALRRAVRTVPLGTIVRIDP
jgi:lipoprotein-anchoring transpeptidase ErfK/SrfK